MDFANEFWIDMNRMQAPVLDFESEFNMPPLSLESGCDFSFDLDDLDIKIEEDYFKYMLNSVDNFDGQSLESSMSSDGSIMSFSPSHPLVDSKTPYSDATQCRRPAKNNGHIRRPMNPFMVFAKQERRRMASVTPNLHNAEISKICGRKWKNMTAEEKRPYEVESARLKVLHEKEYPDYKYKPKKKSKPGKKRSSSERNLNKNIHSNKSKADQQPLKKAQVSESAKTSDSRLSYLMVNGQKIPLKTAKSSDNKSTFNLQLKIDENYKIVPANPPTAPMLQVLPPVSELGSGIRVKEEIDNPLLVTLTGRPNDDVSFPHFYVKSEDKTDFSNRVYFLINCPETEVVEEVTCIY